MTKINVLQLKKLKCLENSNLNVCEMEVWIPLELAIHEEGRWSGWLVDQELNDHSYNVHCKD